MTHTQLSQDNGHSLTLGAQDPPTNMLVAITAGNYNTTDPEVQRVPTRILTDFVLPAAGLEGMRFAEPR